MYKRYAYSVMRMKYNVHDMMRNESYIRTQLISIACTMFLQKLRGHFFLAVGDILWPFFCFITRAFCTIQVSWLKTSGTFTMIPWKTWDIYLGTLASLRKPLQCNLGNLENIYNVTLRTFTWNPWEAWEPWEPWGTEATFTMQPWQPWERLLGNLENLERTFRL